MPGADPLASGLLDNLGISGLGNPLVHSLIWGSHIYAIAEQLGKLVKIDHWAQEPEFLIR